MRKAEEFAKAALHKKSGKKCGYHIIDPQASVLVEEVVNAMATEGTLWSAGTS